MASKVNLERSVSCVLIRIYFISIDNHFDHARILDIICNFIQHTQPNFMNPNLPNLMSALSPLTHGIDVDFKNCVVSKNRCCLLFSSLVDLIEQKCM